MKSFDGLEHFLSAERARQISGQTFSVFRAFNAADFGIMFLATTTRIDSDRDTESISDSLTHVDDALVDDVEAAAAFAGEF